MTLNRTAAACLTLATFLPAAVVAATPRFEDVLEETMELVLIIEDVPTSSASWSELPIVRAWNDPEIQRIIGPLYEGTEESEAWDFSFPDEIQMIVDQ